MSDYVKLIATFAVGILAGVVLGVVFYPSTQKEESIRQKIVQEYELKQQQTSESFLQEKQQLNEKLIAEQQKQLQYESSVQKQLSSLKNENQQLKQSAKKQTIKIVKPDGTIVEQSSEEFNSESITSIQEQMQEEFESQLKATEIKWMSIHTERVQELQQNYETKLKVVTDENSKIKQELEEKSKTIINIKKFRPEIGISTLKEIYAHASYNVIGPLNVGGGISGDIVSNNKKFGEARIGVGVDL